MSRNDTNIVTLKTKEQRERQGRTTKKNIEYYGNMIRESRMKIGMSQGEFAKRLNRTQMNICNWEKGRNRPDLDDIPAICDILNISLEKFFGLRDITAREREMLETYENLSPSGQVAVLDMVKSMERYESNIAAASVCNDLISVAKIEQKVAAGTFNPLDSDNETEFVVVHRNSMTEKADEIITVTGDSMEPTFYDGDELLIERTGTIRSGEIGIFIINGDGFVKEYRDGGVYSHNYEKYPFRRFEEGDEVICYARVIGKVEPDLYASEAELEIWNNRETYMPLHP